MARAGRMGMPVSVFSVSAGDRRTTPVAGCANFILSIGDI
jgi:hypothetical protein